MPNRFMNHIPPTPKGAALTLTAQQEEMCRVVYRILPDGGMVFNSLWNPEVDYSDEYAILPFRSTFKGVTAEMDAGTIFSNIAGSTGDKDTDGKTWIEVCRTRLTGYSCATCCAENNLIYNPADDTAIGGFACTTPAGTSLIGGHVLLGTKHSSTVDEDSDVHLLPICKAHNSYQYVAKKHGQFYYMKLARAMKAVILEGYKPKP